MLHKIILTFTFLAMHLIGYSQTHKWAIDVNAQLNLQFVQAHPALKLDAYINPPQPSYLDIQEEPELYFAYAGAQLAVNYNINNWLTATGNFYFADGGGLEYNVTNSNSNFSGADYPQGDFMYKQEGAKQYRAFEAAVALKADLLSKDVYEAFNILAGVTFGQQFINTQESIIGEIKNQPVNNYIDYTKRYHQFSGFIGAEWRDYFSEHFGYFLGVKYVPPFTLNLIQVKVDSFTRSGVEQEQSGTIISTFPTDDFDAQRASQFGFSLGLSYQF